MKKFTLEKTAIKMNVALAGADRDERWELDGNTLSNNYGFWGCGETHGVGDAETMRAVTKKLISIHKA